MRTYLQFQQNKLQRKRKVLYSTKQPAKYNFVARKKALLQHRAAVDPRLRETLYSIRHKSGLHRKICK
jgi:hypothetical protein